MNPGPNETPKDVPAVEYIGANFHSSDRIALLVRSGNTGQTIQRIATAERIATAPAQDWLQYKNEKESCDIYRNEHPQAASPHTNQRGHPDHPASLSRHRSRWSNGPHEASPIQSCADSQLHHQHFAGEVSGGLAGRRNGTGTSRRAPQGHGAEIRRRSRGY